MRPLKVPVPNASRVTCTPDLPSVTRSVADLLAARAGITPPTPPKTAAAKVDFRKSRLVAPMIHYDIKNRVFRRGVNTGHALLLGQLELHATLVVQPLRKVAVDQIEARLGQRMLHADVGQRIAFHPGAQRRDDIVVLES